MKNTSENIKNLYFDTLFDLGLRTDEAKIYEWLLHNHDQKASEVADGTGISRVLTYRGLDNLLEKNIIEKIEEAGAVAYFTAKHPSHLTTLLEKQKRQLVKAELELQKDLGAMASVFNLATGKPNVQFFEGVREIQKVINDVTSSQTDIYLITDSTKAREKYPELNNDYIQRLNSKNIKRKTIYKKGSQPSSLALNNPLAENKSIPGDFDLGTTVQIYDGKVSYIVLEEGRDIGVIIEDVNIYQTMKAVFEYMWSTAEPIV